MITVNNSIWIIFMPQWFNAITHSGSKMNVSLLKLLMALLALSQLINSQKVKKSPNALINLFDTSTQPPASEKQLMLMMKITFLLTPKASFNPQDLSTESCPVDLTNKLSSYKHEDINQYISTIKKDAPFPLRLFNNHTCAIKDSFEQTDNVNLTNNICPR